MKGFIIAGACGVVLTAVTASLFNFNLIDIALTMFVLTGYSCIIYRNCRKEKWVYLVLELLVGSGLIYFTTAIPEMFTNQTARIILFICGGFGIMRFIFNLKKTIYK